MQRMANSFRNKEFLFQKYIMEKMTGGQIAKAIRVPERTLYSWLVWFDIPRRKSGVEHWPEEQRELRRRWNREHPEINRMKGKKHSSETRAKMSQSRRGSLNANWRDGATTKKRGLKRSPKYYWWRKEVLKRDGAICQECHALKANHVHHVKSFNNYPELRFEISNGLTLCMECHKEIHFQGGISSNIHA